MRKAQKTRRERQKRKRMLEGSLSKGEVDLRGKGREEKGG